MSFEPYEEVWIRGARRRRLRVPDGQDHQLDTPPPQLPLDRTVHVLIQQKAWPHTPLVDTGTLSGRRWARRVCKARIRAEGCCWAACQAASWRWCTRWR
jgi:hypothetical protein